MNDEQRLGIVDTDQAPRPAGHYSQAIVANGFVFVSGQLPIALDRTPRADLDFDDQVRLALRNMLAVLAAAGSGPADVVRVTAYVVGVDNWARFNAVFAQVMGTARPARTVVPVSELHYGCLVEVDAIGLVPGAD